MKRTAQGILIAFGTTLSAVADYEVDIDLGTLLEGNMEISGTTALVVDPGPPEVVTGGRNNADFLTGGPINLNPEANWGNEYVMQFTLASPANLTFSKDVEFAAGDADFFIVEGLRTEFDEELGKTVAQEGIWYEFFDLAPPAQSSVALRTGTYYLVVESFSGFDGALNPVDASFSLNLNVLPALFPDEVKVNLGFVAGAGSPLSFNTFGSSFDTQLAVFSFDGNLLQQNDNAGGTAGFEIVEGSFSWEEARADAEARGGRLAVLNTQDRIDAANAFLDSAGSWPQLWIGLTDAENEGDWRWITEEALSVSSWNDGEPNNSGNEDHALINNSSHPNRFSWNDSNFLHGYLLETRGLQSEVSFPEGLDAGTYIAVVAGAGAVFDLGPITTTGGAVGDIVFNYPFNSNAGPGVGTVEVSTTAGTEVSETVWFEFSISRGSPADFVELGKIADPGVPIQIHTLESLIDTELAIYDEFGYVLYANDDADGAAGVYQSLIDIPAGLTEGVWYAAVGGYNTLWGDGFEVTPGTASGAYSLTHPNGIVPTELQAGVVDWYRFEVGNPGDGGGPVEPSRIEITSLTFDPASNEFTVAWDGAGEGPFSIQMGSARDLAAIDAQDNVLPVTAGVGLTASPVTLRVPQSLAQEPRVFLQVIGPGPIR